MTSLHVHFALRNQQAFQRLLDASRIASTQTTSGAALSSSGGRSWNKPSPLSGGIPAASCDVNARDWLGRTVLHLAVSSLDPAALEFVKLLLAHPRVDVNLSDLESRWTPLHRALYAGNIPACVLLLQRSDVDVSLKDFEGYTAFDVYNSTVEGTKPTELEASDLYTWGTNRNAALGVSDGDDRSFPELVPIPPQKEHPEPSKLSLRERFQVIRVQQVTMAKLHTAVVTSEPRANLRICGFGSGGRLGSGTAQHTQYALSHPKDLTSEAQIISVALGQDHTLALTSSGSVLSWGLARFSQLGYALDGGQTLQAAPRRIVGPLKKESVRGIAACRTASACWTSDALLTWGTNSGQLGYDRIGTPVQVLPRRVTLITLPVIDLALSDVAMAVLLTSRDVQCFYNGRSFKINFPTQSFPSEIQVYRPPMAQNNANIAKVMSCENTFAALSSNGEVFTFSLNAPPSAESGGTPNKTASATLVKPQRIWSLRKQFSAVKDVALGSDGTVLLCTESGHVYLRSRTNKTSKFTRVPLVQRVVSVAASSAGAFAVLKAECTPTPIRIQGKTLAEDLDVIQPFLFPPEKEDLQSQLVFGKSPINPVSSGGAVGSPQSPSDEANKEDEEDSDDTRTDVETISRLLDLLVKNTKRRKAEGKGLYEGNELRHGADLFIRVDSGFEFPVHRIILAARSQVLKDILLGHIIRDSDDRLRCQLVKDSKRTQPVVMLTGVHPLSALMLSVHLYTDIVPAIWDRRVAICVSDKLAECVPWTNTSSVRGELQKLATLLRLPALLGASVPPERLTCDMGSLLVGILREDAWAFDSPRAHPLAPDTVLELSDAQIRCHSTILRARSPFFAGLFDDPDWTLKRKEPDRALLVKLRHVRWRVMDFVMKFIYAGGNEELFDVLDFVHSADDVVEFLFEVMDIAGELLLDRLLLVCSSVILQFLNINNACSILSDASHFNAGQLSSSVQGYLARNLETLLESRMLDDLPAHLVRQFAIFVRARQAEKLYVTRSGKMVEMALETWKDWLALQDIPQHIIQGRKAPSGQSRQSPKLSPQAIATTSKRHHRPSIGTVSTSYSPPVDHRLPLTPPSAPIQEGIETGPDDLFVMDGIREEIPPLSLPTARTSLSTSASKDGPPLAPGSYSPWKARISQLPASKLDLRAIMAEAEGQKLESSSTASLSSRSRVVGFEMSAAGSSVDRSHTPPKLDLFLGVPQLKASPSSPWRIPKAAGTVPGGSPFAPISSPAIVRKSSETQQGALPSGLSRDLREKYSQAQTPTASTSSVQSGQAALGKGKAPVAPPSTSARQPSAAPINRRISEGSTKAWTPMIPEPMQLDGANAPLSFLAIQQQQRIQNTPQLIKKSLLEIQAEEQARAAEERELQEEVEFMQWWAAEEERIRRETQATPGPPIRGPGAGGNQKRGKKPKGGSTRRAEQIDKKSSVLDALGSAQHVADGGEKSKVRKGAIDGQKTGRTRRTKAVALQIAK